MKYWITKYALTQGIFEVEGIVLRDSPKMLHRTKKDGSPHEYYHKPYWYESRERAVAHAVIQCRRKVDALNKQIARLEGLVFK